MKITDEVKLEIISFFIIACTLGLIFEMVKSCDGIFKINNELSDLNDRVNSLELANKIK